MAGAAKGEIWLEKEGDEEGSFGCKMPHQPGLPLKEVGLKRAESN
jgi:hypothetical protein